jgi:hypothetical protein
MIFQPDFFQCLVAFEEKALIEFLDALEESRIVLRFRHCCRPYIVDMLNSARVGEQ